MLWQIIQVDIRYNGMTDCVGRDQVLLYNRLCRQRLGVMVWQIYVGKDQVGWYDRLCRQRSGMMVWQIMQVEIRYDGMPNYVGRDQV